jgi:Ca-activated chloride channel homolog
MQAAIRWAFFVSILLACSGSWAASRGSAPYLAASDGQVEELPLAFTAVDVSIAGVIADVRVKQTYENRGDRTIDVVYVFPGSDRAAIYALTMRVGDRLIRANIRPKQVAKAEFEKARSEGKTASLLEQLDPSIFRMNLANVLPADKIEVELRYTELLVPTKGEYEFFFPSTIGNRYAGQGAEAIDTPTSRDGHVVDYSFDLQVRIMGALPLGEISSASHAIEVERPDAHQAQVLLGEDSQQDAARKDYSLRFRYAGGDIETGIMAFPEKDGGYFLMLAEPPRRVQPAQVVPREFIFVVDVSGSMHGTPLDISKDMLLDLVGSMRPNELFNILQFSGGSKILSESGSVPANPHNLSRARSFIEDATAGGGTELITALLQAYALPRTKDFARSIVIVTDGAIWVAGRDYRAIREHLGEANLFAFGIGPSVERPVINLLARAGMGEPFIVDELGKGREVAQRLREYIDRPLLTGIKLDHDAEGVFDLEPTHLPDLLAERPLVVVGRYRGQSPQDITIKGSSSGQPYQQTVRIVPGFASDHLSALRQLWARQRIQRLLDERQTAVYGQTDGVDHSKEIEALGMEFNLLTPYTSFVAVDQRVRADGTAELVEQPAVAKGSASGYGLAEPISLDMIAPHSISAPPVINAALAARSIGGRKFQLVQGVWTDRSFAKQIVLRVRLGGEAWRKLLAIRPELAQFTVLGERILIAFPTHAILIAPDGFSDYPDDVLALITGSPRG